MEKISSNICIVNCKKVFGNHKEVFCGEIKRVQMVDGIIIFELQRTFWETLHSVIKKFFRTICGIR